MSNERARRRREAREKAKPQARSLATTRKGPANGGFVQRPEESFWTAHGRAESGLRQRCIDLLGDDAPTDSEWVDADLMGMDGLEASDEELVAYWRLFRRAAEHELDEAPELSDVFDALRAGRDPVQVLDERVARWREEDDEFDDE